MKELAPEQLERLRREPAIRGPLASENLRRVLLDIAEANVPEERLEQHLARNPHFDAFMTQCLTYFDLIPANK